MSVGVDSDKGHNCPPFHMSNEHNIKNFKQYLLQDDINVTISNK
jgi:hypothetical protein